MCDEYSFAVEDLAAYLTPHAQCSTGCVIEHVRTMLCPICNQKMGDLPLALRKRRVRSIPSYQLLHHACNSSEGRGHSELVLLYDQAVRPSLKTLGTEIARSVRFQETAPSGSPSPKARHHFHRKEAFTPA